MIEIRRILCPIDFSDASRRALGYALAVAHWYDSTVTLFHVHSIVPVGAFGPGSPALSPPVLAGAERDDLLASLRQFVGEDAGPEAPLELDATAGAVVPSVLAKAEAISSDLIVMGTHGRSGFDRLVLGSVTEKVLRKASCPVLSVPMRVGDVVPAPPALFKTILCAVDFSDCSIAALDYAMSLAQEADAHLTVMHVLEVPEVSDAAPAARDSLLDYITTMEAGRKARLEEAVPETARAYCVVETVLDRGTPYRQILKAAKERGSDLIVLGIQGRGAADLMFFGSTTQHVVREAACPVLTIRRG